MGRRASEKTEPIAARQKSDSDGYLLENQVGHLLRRAHQRHTSIFQATIDDAQLTPLQFAAVMKLNDVGETSQNQLGRLTAMDAATMQGVIKRLSARNLIARRPDPDDRRRLLLTLTDEGVALVDTATGRGHRISDETLDPLSPVERQTFLALLRRLTD